MVLPAILGGAVAFLGGSLLGKGGGLEFFTKKEQRINAPISISSNPIQIISPSQSFQIVGSPNASIRGSQSTQGTQPTTQTATPFFNLGQGGGSGGATPSSPLGDATNLILVGGIVAGAYLLFVKKRK